MLDFEQEGLEIVSLFCDDAEEKRGRSGDAETGRSGEPCPPVSPSPILPVSLFSLSARDFFAVGG
jgi:hypothetical protein